MPRPDIHLRLAERMRSDIISYHDAWPLGSTRDLARRYGAAPNTIRKALAVLVEQGQILRTRTGRYLRKRPTGRQVFCKPYPAVALLSYWAPCLVGPGYMTVLLSSFMTTLASRGLPVCLMPAAGNVPIDVVPGGAIIHPTGMRFSAVAFRSAAPAAVVERLVAAGAVVMLLDGLATVEGADSIAVDCAHEAVRAVDYLAELGHRHIGFVAYKGEHGSEQWQDRIDPDARRFSVAMLAAKQRLGLNASPEYHVECEFNVTRGDAGVHQAIHRLWRLRPAPTALVCMDSLIAGPVEQILLQRGIPCPTQVSILARGVAGAGPCRHTSLISDPLHIGRAAAEHLVNRLISPSSTAAKLLFPSILVEGRTTSPASSALVLA